MTELLTGLANNGPWALMAGVLLQQVIKAWTNCQTLLASTVKDYQETAKDYQEKLTAVLGGFQTALEKLETAVTKLSDRIDTIEGGHRSD